MTIVLCTGVLSSCTIPEIAGDIKLTRISYDSSKELWQDINKQYIARYNSQTSSTLSINESHFGAKTPGVEIDNGALPDVLTFAAASDIAPLLQKGLLQPDWEAAYPNKSVPYYTLMVFLVRKGNAAGVRDWADLARPGVRLIVTNPKSTASGKFTMLAAWASIALNRGSEADAKLFLATMYNNAVTVAETTDAAKTAFITDQHGDVLVTGENEALTEVGRSGGTLEVVYPKFSIRADSSVAVVATVAERNGTRKVANDYLSFLYTKEGQETVARHFFRPQNPEVLKKQLAVFPVIEVISITDVAENWAEAEKYFFVKGAVFDQVSGIPSTS